MTKAFALACLALSVLPAQAFTFNSNDPLQEGWASRPLKFYINRDHCPDNIDALLGQAIALWNSVPESSLKIQIGETSTETSTNLLDETATQVPLIVCDDNFSTNVGVDGDAIAGGGLIGGSSFRPIVYGGLILNMEAGKSARLDALDPEVAAVVVAHEIGHVLGIGHSADPSALMYFNASAKEYLNLGQDDIDAVTFLYPRNEIRHFDLIGGCGLIADATARGPRGPSDGPWGGNSVLLFGGLYGLWAFFRRRSFSS